MRKLTCMGCLGLIVNLQLHQKKKSFKYMNWYVQVLAYVHYLMHKWLGLINNKVCDYGYITLCFAVHVIAGKSMSSIYAYMIFFNRNNEQFVGKRWWWWLLKGMYVMHVYTQAYLWIVTCATNNDSISIQELCWTEFESLCR